MCGSEKFSVMFGKSGYICLKYITKEEHGGTVGMVTVVGEGCSCLTCRTCADIHAQTQAENVCAANVWTVSKTLQKELLLVNIKHIFLQFFSRIMHI